MSFPNIPDVNANISIDRKAVKNLLLASVAFEELGLAHIINAEAEKIQFVLGTLPGQAPPETPTLEDLVMVDQTVKRMIQTVIKNQMLLQFKLEDIFEIPELSILIFRNTATVTATTGNISVADSDSAYYYTRPQ